MIGRTLKQYRITAKLGQGGMGEVYLAEDSRLKREIALKVVPESMAADPDRRSRLEREAQAIAALSHPNIVTIFSVEEAEDLLFITMERVQGQSLSEMIEDGGMPLQQLFDIATPLADAVAAAHERGITHRDLKPDNVMVDSAGRVKVLDFGLAKVTDTEGAGQDFEGATHLPTATVTEEGQILGTVHYMSPEQAEGKRVDARSDVFSLGIVLYEMATGERPFQGDTPISTLSAILKDTPDSVTDLNTRLPRHLDRILRRCLHKDADRRYQTAKELRNELEELKEEIDSGSKETSVPTPKQERAKRPVWLWPAVVGLAIVLAVLVGMKLIDADDDAEREAASVVPDDDLLGPTETADVAVRKMIVVLPFENLGEAEDDYFAAGVTEEITARLGTVGDLGVISSNSAMLYRGTTQSTQQIGEELGVDYLLQGKVRWARSEDGASRVRITPQLVRVADDTQIWADSFDETIDDVFTVQTRIATGVIDELDLALGGGASLVAARPTTDNLEAWQAFLRGKQVNEMRVGSDNPLAEQLLERAVELDPGFVDAWAELSKVHSGRMHMGVDISPQRDNQALEAAETAMRLDPTSPQSHMAMGYYHYWGHKDYEAAMSEFEIAKKLLPNSFEILSARGFVRRRQGNWGGALEDLSRALEINPLQYRSSYEVGLTQQALGNYPAAREMFQRTLNIQPDFTESLFWAAQTHWVENGDLKGGRTAVDSIPAALSENWVAWARYLQSILEREPAAALASLELYHGNRINYMPMIFPTFFLSGWAKSLMGDQDGARSDLESAAAYLESLLEEIPDDYTVIPALGLTYAMLGDREAALFQARRAAELYGIDRDRFFGLNVEIHVAWVETLVGEQDAAIERLKRLLSVPNPYLSPAMLRIHPAWDPLRDNPRFAALLAE